MPILLATGNPDKFREIKKLIALGDLELLWLDDIGAPPPEETGLTLRENARIKAEHGFAASGLLTLAEDTGLFVDGLGGMPGVFSSRFAGPRATYRDNRQKLIQLLKGLPFEKRRARFVACVALTKNGKDFRFVEGSVEGFVLRHEQGEGGFGYDPVFLYPPMGRTFAEMGQEIKNSVSHRARAFRVVKELLRDESRVS